MNIREAIQNVKSKGELNFLTQIRGNLPIFSTIIPSNICMFLSCRPFIVITTGLVGVNVVLTTKGLQDRNIHILDETTVENKGKLILTEIFPSVQKHDI